MRFFEPSDEWLDWAAAYAGGRMVFDVGCGEGHVVRALRERRVPAIGVDPMWEWAPDNRDLVSAIIPAFAEHCRLLQKWENGLVLFCRPCHGGFVDAAVRLLHASSEVLYISRPSNVNVDIDLDDFLAEAVECPACPEERVFRISPRSRRVQPRSSRTSHRVRPPTSRR
jgi:hypothetical protein